MIGFGIGLWGVGLRVSEDVMRKHRDTRTWGVGPTWYPNNGESNGEGKDT